MLCVVFGGGGFIGSAIADRLLASGHQVRIFERPRVVPYRTFAPDERVQWIGGDLLSVHDVRAAVDGADAVFHLVSTTLPKNSNEDLVYDVQSNLVGTLQLLGAVAESSVRRVLFISSGGTVYGIPAYLPIDERHPTDPLVSYGITKLAIEKYLALFQRMHGVRTLTLRVSNAFGERQRVETAQGAIGVFLDRALHGLPIEIWGDGTVTRDYIHVSDVADAFVRALTYEGAHGVMNVSSGVGVSLNELVSLLEDVLATRIERRYLPGRAFDVPVNVLANERARAELGWSPRVTLREGIAATARWMRAALAGPPRSRDAREP